MQPFWVYMLRCANGSFYVGHTDNLERRFGQHQSGDIPGYTHKCRPVELVFSQPTYSRIEALEAERQIKGWSRAKRQALISGNWERINRLGRGKHKHQRLAEAAAAQAGQANPEECLVPKTSLKLILRLRPCGPTLRTNGSFI